MADTATKTLTAIQPDQLPTPREESWKYTNLPRAVPDGLTRDTNEEEIIIHLKKGEVRQVPEIVEFEGNDGTMQIAQMAIKLEEGAEMTLIERHTGEGEYWKNRVTQIDVAKNAKLTHYRIQNDSKQAINTNMVHMSIARDAVYDSVNLNIGGKLTRHEIKAVIEGENAECTLNGLNLLNGDQHGDTTILIEHQAPNCQSNQFYRTLLDDKSRGVFQGKVHVHQEAQKTDGYQLANTLLLSPDAEMDVKPELEIYADDVKCSHGSTIGQIDEEPLFYLRQRGLTDAQARLLLVQAFVDEVVEKVEDENIRTEMQDIASNWLHAAMEK